MCNIMKYIFSEKSNLLQLTFGNTLTPIIENILVKLCTKTDGNG